MKTFREFLTLKEDVNIQGEDNYKFVNGKSPSGMGSWFFSPKSRINFDTDVQNKDYIVVNDSYSNAKLAAKKWGSEHGYSTMYVQS